MKYAILCILLVTFSFSGQQRSIVFIVAKPQIDFNHNGLRFDFANFNCCFFLVPLFNIIKFSLKSLKKERYKTSNRGTTEVNCFIVTKHQIDVLNNLMKDYQNTLWFVL